MLTEEVMKLEGGHAVSGESASEIIDKFDDTNDYNIDREQEDKDVVEYQKTGDIKVLEKIYEQRVRTLKKWSNQHYFPGLTDSIQDFYEDLVVVFLKAIEKYDSSRGASFNSCLWTFLENRIKNIKNSRHAKKRVSEFYDGPMNSMVLSLNYSYGNKEGSEVTLQDLLSSKQVAPEKTNSIEDMSLNETIDLLSEDSTILKGFFRQVSMGGSLASLLREYKTKTGKIKINPEYVDTLSGKRRCNKIVKDLIIDKTGLNEFKVVEYDVDRTNHLNYVVEMNSTEESDLIMKTIRNLRKNKDFYSNKLGVDIL